MKLTTALAALLLVVVACQVTYVSAQKHRRGDNSRPLYMFGWTPVTFDKNTFDDPVEPIQRRPKLLNFRCKQACAALQMNAVTTPDGKPLCYMNATRALGATYQIYGTWYEGEAGEDYESTCRGRDENGKERKEWANKWDTKAQRFVPGYFCGCCGCVSGCGYAPTNNRTYTCARAYNMQGNTTGCPAKGSRGTYPVCYGDTASFGQEWGTWLSDDTCTTYRSLVASDPKFMCVAQAGPPVVTAPPPRASWPRPHGAELVRLDLLKGLALPEPSEDVVRQAQEARLTRTAQEP